MPQGPLTSDVTAAMVHIALLGLRTVEGKAAGLCWLPRKPENDQLSLSGLPPVEPLPAAAGRSFSRGKYFLRGWLVEKLMSFIPSPEGEAERCEQSKLQHLTLSVLLLKEKQRASFNILRCQCCCR